MSHCYCAPDGLVHQLADHLAALTLTVTSGFETLTSVAAGLQTLLKRDEEAKGGFSTASQDRTCKALLKMGFQQRQITLIVKEDEKDDKMFIWTTAKEDAKEQRGRYMKHLREKFQVPSEFVWLDANGEDGDAKVPTIPLHVEGVYDLNGTTDVLLVSTLQRKVPLDNVEMIVELKKNVSPIHEFQAIVELLAHGCVARDKRVVGLLTDLNKYFRFYWFEKSGSLRFVHHSQVMSSTAAYKIIEGILNIEVDQLAERCAMPPSSDLWSIPEDAVGRLPDKGKDEEDDEQHHHPKTPTPSANEKSQPQKKSSASTSGNSKPLPEFQSVREAPGFDFLTLINGDNLRDDLEVAREYVRTFIIPAMPGLVVPQLIHC